MSSAGKRSDRCASNAPAAGITTQVAGKSDRNVYIGSDAAGTQGHHFAVVRPPGFPRVPWPDVLLVAAIVRVPAGGLGALLDDDRAARYLGAGRSIVIDFADEAERDEFMALAEFVIASAA